jgi:hypothetical protein
MYNHHPGHQTWHLYERNGTEALACVQNDARQVACPDRSRNDILRVKNRRNDSLLLQDGLSLDDTIAGCRGDALADTV